MDSESDLNYGYINQEEHLSNLLAHFRGIRHPEDNENVTAFYIPAPFAASLKRACIEQKVIVDGIEHGTVTHNGRADMLADIDPWAKLFLDCIQKHSVSTTRIMELLGPDGVIPLLQPLAILAAERDKVDVLKYCIEKGASLDDPYFSRAVVLRGASRAMLDLLWNVDWENIQKNQTQLNKLLFHAWLGESSAMLS